ncbi:MAG: hypothetical protein AAF442_09380 [Pseudomonadota bacterium]
MTPDSLLLVLAAIQSLFVPALGFLFSRLRYITTELTDMRERAARLEERIKAVPSVKDMAALQAAIAGLTEKVEAMDEKIDALGKRLEQGGRG